MLTFVRVKVQGFRSFNKPQTFDFTTPGLTYLTGKNLVEKDLGANGIGKSSLFEALFWCLFGKTSRSLRAGDVRCWSKGALPCKVTLSLKVDGEAVTITRSWDPNALKIEDRLVEQTEVDELIGLNSETFLYSLYHAQFVPQFVDLSPSDQLYVYGRVLNLTVWEEASEVCTKMRRQVEGDQARVRITAANLKGELKQLRSQLEQELDKEQRWVRKRNRDMQELQDKLSKSNRLRTRSAAALRGAFARVKKIPLATAREDVSVQKQLVKVIERELSNYETHHLKDGEPCPVCFQAVDAELLGKIMRDKRGEAKKNLRQATDELEKLEHYLQLMQARHDSHNHVVAEIEGQMNRSVWAIEDYEKSISKLKDEQCPFDSKGLEQDVFVYESKIEKREAELEDLEQLTKGYEYWGKAFREIRLALISDSLTQFELSTNNALEALGLGGWQVKFDIQSETKGGKLRKGFTVLVKNLNGKNKSAVPFIAWSGGESQRIRLAITIGLSDVIQDFTATRSNVEIFDEPTAWLSKEGIGDLLAAMQQRAADNQCAILLADHKILDSAFASRIISLTKDAEGTWIR